jgi:hypothetical protein
MQVVTIRHKLHNYVDKGDEKLLKLMYAIAKEYNGEAEIDYEFSDEELKLFEESRHKRISGENETLNWEAAKEIITGKNKS